MPVSEISMCVFQKALLAIVEQRLAMYKHGCSDAYTYLGGRWYDYLYSILKYGAG